MFPKLIKLSILFVLLLAGYNTASASFTISRPSTHNLGLVGHWTFDGKNVVNGVALDSSGTNNGNLVNIATSTFYSYGKIGQGFNFDGSNDYVNIGDTFYSDIFTVCAWFKSDVMTGTTGKTIVGKRNSSGITAGTSEWAMSIDSGTLQFISWNSGGGVTHNMGYNTALTANTWYHGCAVQRGNGNTSYLYLNSVVDASASQTSAMVNSASLIQIGVRVASVNTRYFDGIIDDVRIYNRALSAGEVKNLYNQGVSKFNKTPTNAITNSLVGHWTFDGKNVVNGVALDSSGTNNGNLVNIATSTFYSYGKIGQGFNFDGVNDYVNAGNPAILTDINVKTISTWIKLNGYGETSYGRVFDKENGNSDGWNFFVGNAAATNLGSIAYLHHGIGSYGVWSSPTNSITVGNWYHAVMVYDRTSYLNDPVFYINGALVATTENQSPPAGAMDNDNLRSVFIGNSNAAAERTFNGSIDDVRVYNRALSAGEIKMLYNMGR